MSVFTSTSLMADDIQTQAHFPPLCIHITFIGKLNILQQYVNRTKTSLWQKHILKDPFFDKWIDINCWIIYIFAFISFYPLMSWSTGHLIRQLWLIFFHPENLTKMSFQINLIEVLCRYFAQICLIEFFSSVEIYNQDNYVFCVNYCACPLTRLL